MRRILELAGSINPVNPTYSSVLILLYPFEGDIFTVFMKRPDYGGVHSGQISLPGGKYEPADGDLKTTALRESQEEIGIFPKDVRIIGKLTDLYIPPSRYLVTPYVGWAPQRPAFVRDPKEVDEIIEIRINVLFKDETISVRKIKLPLGMHIKAPAFVVNKQVIWGATAMILSEFWDVIRGLL
ncbi:MAG: CoA pyrophosphatase [bacterium]